MKTFFCFSAFFLLIFTDICSARATKTLPPIFHAAKEGDCSKCPKHKPMDWQNSGKRFTRVECIPNTEEQKPPASHRATCDMKPMEEGGRKLDLYVYHCVTLYLESKKIPTQF
ncbi:hypothetical protein AVEN_246047-1 [Araneus ventricosus]|uniref:Secreted protein n=1 Tax=Araneus ventricosus TaxID=182803 RepID=A0A4Y2U8I7_ARAVE|nr:hypothetical protein AVEN_246047-1 [Araneus ventricosus]